MMVSACDLDHRCMVEPCSERPCLPHVLIVGRDNEQHRYLGWSHLAEAPWPAAVAEIRQERTRVVTGEFGVATEPAHSSAIDQVDGLGFESRDQVPTGQGLGVPTQADPLPEVSPILAAEFGTQRV